MHLYNLSLVRGGGATDAVSGSFSGDPKSQEFVIAHGNRLELMGITTEGTLESRCFTEVFGVIRSIRTLKVQGTKSYVVVGSDSGRLTILEYDNKRQQFARVHCETFGKSGCRRIVPGQYVAVDPNGRVVMVCAVEKQKFVYTITRDNEEKLVITSPLEAHKQNTIVFDACGLDVGLENPMFGCLEFDYTDADGDFSGTGAALGKIPKNLVYYEVEEGLNHVVRKAIQPTLRSGNKLIPLPGGADGPGGVFVCGDGFIQYHHIDKKKDDAVICKPIPRRCDVPSERGTLIVSFSSNHRKTKDGQVILFFLLQSEYGDLFKLEVELSNTDSSFTLTDFHIQYFDTIPIAKSICISKRGFMFAASEAGNHYLYKFTNLDGVSLPGGDKTFPPKPIGNLAVCDMVQSLAPCTAMKVAELCSEERNQIYVTSGQGARSALRILRQGLKVTEMAVSDLPGTPSAVWTVRSPSDENNDQYIVVSFANATLVLSVGETVTQATDSGLLGEVQTIAMERMEDGSLVQVHPGGIHHMSKDGKQKLNGWAVPSGRRIDCAAVNRRQVAIALEGGNIHYFELEQLGQDLVHQPVFDMGEDVKCLGLGQVPQGRVRSPFLAVGTFGNSVQLLSLDPANRMKQLSGQALPDQSTSIELINMVNPTSHDETIPTLCVGLRNGVLVQSHVDEASGQILDTKTSFLGPGPVRCFHIKLPFSQGQNNANNKQAALLALSVRPWVSFVYQNQARLTSLSYSTLSCASNFVSELCDGVVGISGNQLCIFSLQDLGQTFNMKTIRLSYTPRKMLIHDKLIITLEGDHNVVNHATQKQQTSDMEGLSKSQYGATSKAGDEDDESDDDEEDREVTRKGLTLPQVGLAKIGQKASGAWASCIRMIDANGTLKSLIHLDENEFAVSCCFVSFDLEDGSGSTRPYLVVGTVTGLTLHPQSFKSASLRVYAIYQQELSLIHVTPVEGGIPRAMCSIQDKLVVGLGHVVRIYSNGKSKLLRKSEVKCMPTGATYLRAIGNRIFATDANESVHLLTYSPQENTLSLFADDTIPRLCVNGEVLDYDTIAGCDKFGNMFVLRLPNDIGDTLMDTEANLTGGNKKLLWDQAKLDGAPNKLEQVAQFHVGEIITDMQKTTIVPGKAESLVYCTMFGTIGCFLPFNYKSDIEMFSMLEMHLRNNLCELVGREHLPYRSYYAPVKNVVDGDLCEQFQHLPLEKQEEIANELDRTPAEIIKKLEDFRNRIL